MINEMVSAVQQIGGGLVGIGFIVGTAVIFGLAVARGLFQSVERSTAFERKYAREGHNHTSGKYLPRTCGACSRSAHVWYYNGTTGDK